MRWIADEDDLFGVVLLVVSAILVGCLLLGCAADKKLTVSYSPHNQVSITVELSQ